MTSPPDLQNVDIDHEAVATSPRAEGDTDTQPGRRWPSIFALGTAWLLPATTARRTAHVSLKSAFRVHLIAALLLIVLIDSVVAFYDSSYDFGEVMGEMLEEFTRDPKEAILGTVSLVVFVELCFLCLAALLGSWGARDEPIRSSFKQALRCTWLQSAHVLPTFLLCAIFVGWVEEVRHQWYRTDGNSFESPTPPVAPANANDPAAQQAFQKAYAEYLQLQREAWNVGRQSQPWYVRYDEAVIGYTVFGAGIWVLWALLRAIGARRALPPVERPPTCETCGYNLTGAAMEGRCPECGEPVAASLGQDIRPGTIWQRRRQIGRLRAWWRCCVDPIFRPQAFGRQIQVSSSRTDHRVFLVMHLPLVFLVGMLGLWFLYAVVEQKSLFASDHDTLEVRWILGPLIGYVSAITVLCAAMFVSVLAGLQYRMEQKRNLIPAAMQMGCYLASYLVLWACFAMFVLVGVGALWKAGVYNNLRTQLRVDTEFLAFLSWLFPNLLCLWFYFRLVSRGTAGARYANR